MTNKANLVRPAKAWSHEPRCKPRQCCLGALLLVACMVLGACSLGKKTRRMFGGKVLIEVAVAESLNEDFPVAVDFVVVYDRDLLKELETLDAATWFEKERGQYLKGFDDRLDLHPFEWVPGQKVEPQSVSHRLGARAGVVFAHYFAAGEHRALVEPLKHFHLQLGEDDLETARLESGKMLTKMEKIKTRQEKKARRKAKKKAKRAGGDSSPL